MKRRGFFKLLGAVPTVALIPFAKAAPASIPVPAPVPAPVCEHVWGTAPSCCHDYSGCLCISLTASEIPSHTHSTMRYGGSMRATCLKCGIAPGAPR